LPEDQRQTVVVLNTELAPAVEGDVEILCEPDVGFVAGARQRTLGDAKLPLLEQLIQVLDTLGVEPQAHVAGAGLPSRSQTEFTLPEGQPGEHQFTAILVPIEDEEADRFVPPDRRAHVGHEEHRIALPDGLRKRGHLFPEIRSLSGAAGERPANHITVVQVSSAMDVSACVEKDADALELSIRRCQMQRARVVTQIASCASASFAAGFRGRSNAKRSFASFFKYSYDARSGRLRDNRHLPSMRARCPQLSGRKSGSLAGQRSRARVGFDP
jgi:hypothetical protein